MTTATTNYSSTTDSTALTLTLASLASSSSLTVGRESTVIDNTSSKYLDMRVFGQITTGTSPTTAKRIAIYVYAPTKVVSGTFSYPVATATALTGSDAAATFEAEQRNMLKRGAVITVNATSDRAYSFSFNIAPLFGGWMPLKCGLWVVHETGVNLNSTAGNHWIHYTGMKTDSA